MDKNICIRLEADAKQIMECRETMQNLENSMDSLSGIMNLMGNPVRLKILYLLNQEKRLCVCDLSDILEMNVSAISQHLRKLKDRNLITSQKEGQIIHYSLVTDHSPLLYPIFDLLDKKEQIKPVNHE